MLGKVLNVAGLVEPVMESKPTDTPFPCLLTCGFHKVQENTDR